MSDRQTRHCTLRLLTATRRVNREPPPGWPCSHQFIAPGKAAYNVDISGNVSFYCTAGKLTSLAPSPLTADPQDSSPQALLDSARACKSSSSRRRDGLRAPAPSECRARPPANASRTNDEKCDTSRASTAQRPAPPRASRAARPSDANDGGSAPGSSCQQRYDAPGTPIATPTPTLRLGTFALMRRGGSFGLRHSPDRAREGAVRAPDAIPTQSGLPTAAS